MKLWDATTGVEILALKGHPGGVRVNSVAFSPDGKQLVSGDFALSPGASKPASPMNVWLACWTNKEVAEEVGLSEPQLSEIASKFGIGNLAKTELANAEHATDFEPPIYNVWKQQTKSSGSSHFGNSESRWLDNLLYMYTQPFDVVV